MLGLLGAGLAFLGRRATHLLFAGVFIGLALPDLAAVFRPVLAPAVVGLLLTTLLRVDWSAMAGYARRPWLIGLLVIWFLLVTPLATWLVVRVMGLPESLSTAVVLMAAAPPIIGAGAIAVLLGLDGALAVVTSLVSTLLLPLTLPPLALVLLGFELEVELVDFMLRLAALVVSAFLGAAAIRAWAGPERLADRGRQIDGIFVIFMLIFAVAIMDGVAEALVSQPRLVGLWLMAAFLANPLLQVLGALAFAWLGRSGALTVGLLTGNCNMGLILAALPAGADFHVTLFFALAQLPMYMLPAMLLPIYRRLLIAKS